MTPHGFIFQRMRDHDQAAAVQEFLVATAVEGSTPDIRTAAVIVKADHHLVLEVETGALRIFGNDGDVFAFNQLFQQTHDTGAGSSALVRASVGSSFVTLFR